MWASVASIHFSTPSPPVRRRAQTFKGELTEVIVFILFMFYNVSGVCLHSLFVFVYIGIYYIVAFSFGAWPVRRECVWNNNVMCPVGENNLIYFHIFCPGLFIYSCCGCIVNT